MRPDVLALKDFYASPMGRMCAQILNAHIAARWQADNDLRFLAIGYGIPFMPQGYERAIALMPARQGALIWPESAPNRTVLSDEMALPFQDSLFDRILLIHTAEFLDHVRGVLREVWRVLAPGGRVIVITPNRTGLWARIEATPFGNGRPFSRTQLRAILNDALLSPRHWNTALHLPPFHMLRRLMPMGEKMGSTLWPGLGGVHIVEAEKVFFAARPIAKKEKVTTPLGVPAGAAQARVAKKIA